MCMFGWMKSACYLTPAFTTFSFTHTYEPLLWRGLGLLARGMNKTKYTCSIINLHTLSLRLHLPRCKVNQVCIFEDGERWMRTDSSLHDANLPLASEHHSGEINTDLASASVVYQIQGFPVPTRLCSNGSPTAMNHSVKQASSCRRNQPNAEGMQESSFLFGLHWNRLRCRSSGGAEQRKEQSNHPSLSCDDNDLWKDRKCKERANTSQSATVPSTRPAGSRMEKSKGQELAPKGKWDYNSLRISRKHAVWLGVSRWKKILQCSVWASSKISFQTIWWYFLFRVALKEASTISPMHYLASQEAL